MLTHVPLQHRWAAVVPHSAPSGRVVATHMLSTQATLSHAFAATQSSSTTHSGGGASMAASTTGGASTSASITTSGGPPQYAWIHA